MDSIALRAHVHSFFSIGTCHLEGIERKLLRSFFTPSSLYRELKAEDCYTAKALATILDSNAHLNHFGTEKFAAAGVFLRKTLSEVDGFKRTDQLNRFVDLMEQGLLWSGLERLFSESGYSRPAFSKMNPYISDPIESAIFDRACMSPLGAVLMVRTGQILNPLQYDASALDPSQTYDRLVEMATPTRVKEEMSLENRIVASQKRGFSLRDIAAQRIGTADTGYIFNQKLAEKIVAVVSAMKDFSEADRNLLREKYEDCLSAWIYLHLSGQSVSVSDLLVFFQEWVESGVFLPPFMNDLFILADSLKRQNRIRIVSGREMESLIRSQTPFSKNPTHGFFDPHSGLIYIRDISNVISDDAELINAFIFRMQALISSLEETRHIGENLGPLPQRQQKIVRHAHIKAVQLFWTCQTTSDNELLLMKKLGMDFGDYCCLESPFLDHS